MPSDCVWLNAIRNPYGPCPAAMEAAAAPMATPGERLADCLKSRLSETYRVPANAIRFQLGVDRAIATMLDRLPGPVVAFPPSALASTLQRDWAERECVRIVRGAGRGYLVDGDDAADLPAASVVVVDSPSDPLGALLSIADAVRIARAARLLVVDERFAEISGFSLLPLALEFNNVVVLRSFDAWAGLGGPPLSWSVASPASADLAGLSGDDPEPSALAAALATVDNLASVRATMKLMLEERSRLFRLLRRFAILEPVPSWGPFVSARVTVVSRSAVIEGLAARGIFAHAPNETGLEPFIRFGIGTRSEMERLRAALVDLVPALLR